MHMDNSRSWMHIISLLSYGILFLVPVWSLKPAFDPKLPG